MFVLYCKSDADCAHDCIVGLYGNSYERDELLFNFFVYSHVMNGLTSGDLVFGFSLEDKELTEEELEIFREIYIKNIDTIEASREKWTGIGYNPLKSCDMAEMWYAFYDADVESVLSIVNREDREQIVRILGTELWGVD